MENTKTSPVRPSPRVKREYTGIGSRETPAKVGRAMTGIACILEFHGYVLRSGAAPGADTFFEDGVIEPRNKKIFVPWPGFQGRKQEYTVPDKAYEVAARYFPGLDRLGQGIQRLMARNAQQIEGEHLNDPSHFVLCWTQDGCEHGKDRIRSGPGKTGGTGQAIEHASAIGVPVFNMFNRGWSDRFMELTDIDLHYFEEYCA